MALPVQLLITMAFTQPVKLFSMKLQSSDFGECPVWLRLAPAQPLGWRVLARLSLQTSLSLLFLASPSS